MQAMDYFMEQNIEIYTTHEYLLLQAFIKSFLNGILVDTTHKYLLLQAPAGGSVPFS